MIELNTSLRDPVATADTADSVLEHYPGDDSGLVFTIGI